VTYRSDTSDGPTAGTETVNPLELLARVLGHIPDQGHVTTRYYGWYVNRPRRMREQTALAAAAGPFGEVGARAVRFDESSIAPE
jgi:hypothetical protein